MKRKRKDRGKSADQPGRMQDGGPGRTSALDGTDPQSHGMLRHALAVEGFEIVLVGKDGGIKQRESQPLPARRLFETIDVMPMRQREMLR